ncbi:MAG TPA: three-Cys-motif partner protein TcmP [Vicinamibacterales bacterium]|nr:three-Cys-motif partner protein TcmP [Vicinamibacterales bacterium]
MSGSSDPHPDYWVEYGPFQRVKHDLIRAYLGGWFAKLGWWAGRVLYVDTHAGRGRHVTGEPGSPLVALKTFLDHSFRDRLLEKSEFHFLFIERDAENLKALDEELNSLGKLPKGVFVGRNSGDAFQWLSDAVGRLRNDRKKVAPAFVFVDPYGFKVPAKVLVDLMTAGRVELFINVIWRELDMAVQQRPGTDDGLAKTLDSIFGGDDWRTEITALDVSERMNQAVRLLARKIGAKWWTYVRMVSGGQATRYILLHLTNHDKGRDLMKDCIWSIIPEGGFEVLKSEDPRQPRLIEREPDFRPLREWVVERLAESPKRWSELEEGVRSTHWRTTHLNDMIKDLRRDEVIFAEDYAGRFSRIANPLLRLP